MLKPNRKRLSIDQDAAPGNRRGCLVTGAILGVLAGFIVGLFVIPPLINRYFADNPIHSTLLGLLLWPFHSKEQKSSQLNSVSWIEYIKQVFQKFF